MKNLISVSLKKTRKNFRNLMNCGHCSRNKIKILFKDFYFKICCLLFYNRQILFYLLICCLYLGEVIDNMAGSTILKGNFEEFIQICVDAIFTKPLEKPLEIPRQEDFIEGSNKTLEENCFGNFKTTLEKDPILKDVDENIWKEIEIKCNDTFIKINNSLEGSFTEILDKGNKEGGCRDSINNQQQIIGVIEEKEDIGTNSLNSIFESDFWIFSDSFLCLLFFVFLIFILYYYLYYYNNINNSIRLIVIYISQYFQNEFLENSKIKKTFGKSVSFFYSMHIFLLLLIFFFTYNKYYFGHSFIFNFIIFLIIIIKSFYNIYLIFHFRVKFIKDLKIFQVPLKKTIFLILSNLSIFFNILIIVISIYQIFLLFL